MFSLQAGIISRFYKWKQDFSCCPLLLVCFWAVISDGTLATLQMPQPGTFKIWACDIQSGECRATINSRGWSSPSNKPAALDTHTACKTGQGDPASGLGGLGKLEMAGVAAVSALRFMHTKCSQVLCYGDFSQLFHDCCLKVVVFLFISAVVFPLPASLLLHVFFPRHFPLFFCVFLLHILNLLGLLIIWDTSHGCYLLFAAATHCLPKL